MVGFDNFQILYVTFCLPAVVELQGSVEIFTLVYISNTGTSSKVLGPDADNATLTDLTPNTEYSITLTISIIGGASITSPAINATTLDGGKRQGSFKRRKLYLRLYLDLLSDSEQAGYVGGA